MGLLSHRVKRNKIKAGDHIYTWRAAFTYSHHGIYIGEGKVVHFIPHPNPNFSSSNSTITLSSSSSLTNPNCTNPYCQTTQQQPTGGGVVVSCLDCFISTGSLHLFEYGVSSLVFLTKLRGGTCTTAKSDTRAEVVHRAMYLLENGFGKYDVLQNNCEDFALYCKTGLIVIDRSGFGRSGQVSQASSFFVGAPLTALASYPLLTLVPSPVGVATVTAGVYYVSGRCASDIGVRSDVVKVGVKDLALNLGWMDQANSGEKGSSESI